MGRRIPSNRTSFNASRHASDWVAAILSKNYSFLKEKLCVDKTGDYLSMSYEDMFHNAILYTIQDERAAALTTENQVLKYFEYRYRWVVVEIVKDSQLIEFIPYADNKQAEEEPEE